MKRFVLTVIISVLLVGLTRESAFADPPLTFTQMPICGDQDGSESPVVVRCPSFIQSTDVQIYQVPTTGQVDLRFDFVYRGANYNNELGFYKVENATGTINGLNPGDPGYLTAAMTNATIIFHSGSDATTPDVTFRLNAGELLAFFIIQNDTLDNFRANNPNNEITKHPVAFFALDRLNPDNQLDHFVGFRNTTTNYTQFGFEDLTNGGDKDYDDIVYNITPPLQPLTGQVDLKPLSICLQQGQSHTLTATVNGLDGKPLSGVPVNLTVTGVNNVSRSTTTDATGNATFSYTGTSVGKDTLVASATINGQTIVSNNAFTDWTATPCNEPLIFIPGIAGSSLYSGNDELWPAMGYALATERNARHRRLSLAGEGESNIVARDVLRFVDVHNYPDQDTYATLLNYLTQTLRYREYQIGVNVSRRTSAGCDESQKTSSPPTLFVFAYDWRKDNGVAAGQLADYIQCIRKFHPTGKINILAHSMGGLVARRYVINHPGDNAIGKLITIDTPWLGSPKAIYVLETGNFLDNQFWVANADILRDIVSYFPGGHELLPSEVYWQNYPAPFAEQGSDASGNPIFIPYTYSDFVSLMDKRYPLGVNCAGDNNCRAGTWSKDFHNSPGQDRWTEVPTKDIKYHYIYGIRPTSDTIERVIWARKGKVVCKKDQGFVCKEKSGLGLVYGEGDKTVPVGSETRLQDSSPVVYHRITSEPTEHGEIVKNSQVHKLITSILNGQASVQTAELQSFNAAVQEPAYYLTIIGIGSAVVSDATRSISGEVNGEITNQLPQISYYPTGEESFDVIVPAGGTYTVTLQSSDSPMYLEMTKGIPDAVTEATRYSDLSLPPNHTAVIVFTEGQPPAFKYDSNGDSVPDTLIAPTVAVSGPQANDTQPPTITITVDRARLVTLTAVDPAGVKATYYSFDGINFQSYGAPVQAPQQVTTVSVFADDTLANRSPLISYPLPTGQAGDCNNDHTVGAADITALALEFFDGDDNNNPLATSGGSYPGTPACDANQDNHIGASDITCIAQIFFNGVGACQRVEGAGAMAQPVLSLPPQVTAAPGSAVTVPIHLQANGNQVSSLLFSLDYDERRLSFDPTDSNQDGIPDAVTFHALDQYIKSVSFDPNDTDGELDIMLANFAALPEPLREGAVMTVTLHTGNVENATAAVKFSQAPQPSFGGMQGQELAGITHEGAIHINPTHEPVVGKFILYLPAIKR